MLKKEEETCEPNKGKKRVTSSSPSQYNKRKKESKQGKANIRASDKIMTTRSCSKMLIDDDEDVQIVEDSKENKEDSVSEAHNGCVEEEDEDVDDEIRDL